MWIFFILVLILMYLGWYLVVTVYFSSFVSMFDETNWRPGDCNFWLCDFDVRFCVKDKQVDFCC